ncbi:hypothetical protein D7X32_11875 [Corallococcus carmarthensis]|uniref:Uncharacterized protein n=1 Tax=Corallococcus carmarthensis TaxID=2316728 RepID=A0A3A8K7E7_9BACT|nr:hypothetical protein D7X32_11875 [Corallococcus carmarthensis]
MRMDTMRFLATRPGGGTGVAVAGEGQPQVGSPRRGEKLRMGAVGPGDEGAQLLVIIDDEDSHGGFPARSYTTGGKARAGGLPAPFSRRSTPRWQGRRMASRCRLRRPDARLMLLT